MYVEYVKRRSTRGGLGLESDEAPLPAGLSGTEHNGPNLNQYYSCLPPSQEGVESGSNHDSRHRVRRVASRLLRLSFSKLRRQTQLFGTRRRVAWNLRSPGSRTGKSKSLPLTNIITPHKLSTIPHAAILGPHTKPRIANQSSVFGKETQQEEKKQQNERVELRRQTFYHLDVM